MNRIREVLKQKGIKQKLLAEKIGKSDSQVSRYVNNNSQPTLDVLFKIAKALRVKPRDLLSPD